MKNNYLKENEKICPICSGRPSILWKDGKLLRKELDENLVCDGCSYAYYQQNRAFTKNNLTKVK